MLKKPWTYWCHYLYIISITRTLYYSYIIELSTDEGRGKCFQDIWISNQEILFLCYTVDSRQNRLNFFFNWTNPQRSKPECYCVVRMLREIWRLRKCAKLFPMFYCIIIWLSSDLMRSMTWVFCRTVHDFFVNIIFNFKNQKILFPQFDPVWIYFSS